MPITDPLHFRTAEAWREALGLLPVPLRDTEENRQQYVLLNGTSGNFCLDFLGGLDSISQRSAAWSCDVGHYITCVAESVVVNRWEKEAPEERYSWNSVVLRLHEFHRHLEKTTPDRSRSIARHILGVFRRIRAVIREDNEGLLSLRVLLHLLASAAAGQERLPNNDLPAWGLTPAMAQASQLISTATWQPLYNDLLGMSRFDVLRPDFSLVLRHAAGAVFQDAHLEVNNSPTFWLPGFELPATVDPNAVPSQTGVYFTPPALARTLAEEATINVEVENIPGPLVIFDPACGSGELLKECLRLLKIRGYRGQARLIGWDKSPAAVDMARFVLAWESRSWLAGRVEFEISERDSVTAERWPDGIDILVMNPPFKSWQLMSSTEQEAVNRIVGPSSKPNLAMAFARRALPSLRNAGVLAMIAPNSLLEGDSGKDTREAIAQALNPQLIARLGNQTIFARALVDAGMYVGRKKPAAVAPTAVVWADTRLNSLGRALRGLRKWRGAETRPISEDGFSVYVRNDVGISGDPWLARAYDAWFGYKQFQSSAKMVAANKLFDIKQGVRLGNDVFVVSKDYVQGLKKAEQRFFRPAVMNPSITDGSLSDANYAFYPYTVGLPPITSERLLEEYVPNYYENYLLPAKPALKARQTLARHPNLKWWDLLWHRAWQTARKPKIVSKYFGASRSFAFDKSGDFVVVVGNGWLLKRGALGELPQEITDDETYSAMIAYLSSSLADDLLEYMSVQVAGGQLDLSNKYIRELPVPNFSKLKPSELRVLVQMGRNITVGKVESWSEINTFILSVFQ